MYFVRPFLVKDTLLKEAYVGLYEMRILLIFGKDNLVSSYPLIDLIWQDDCNRIDDNCKVCDFIDDASHQWNADSLVDILPYARGQRSEISLVYLYQSMTLGTLFAGVSLAMGSLLSSLLLG